MGDINLKGPLNLMGNLTLKGGQVMINGVEALVQVTPGDDAQCSSAPPVIIPPPPGAPLAPDPTVWIVNSFNQTVKAGEKSIVALGMAMQGKQGAPMWPGMVLPSSANTNVTINQIPINVKGDMAVIFPSGGSATFSQSSGQ